MGNVFVRLILFSCAVILSASAIPTMAQPLQGFAEQSDTPTRIQRPANDIPNPVVQGNANQATLLQQHPSLVNTEEFSRQTPRIQLPVVNPHIAGGARYGQDEYWISWDVWRGRIADAVWGPLKAQGIIMWGMTVLTIMLLAMVIFR